MSERRVDYEITSVNARWIAMKNIMGSYFVVCGILLIVIFYCYKVMVAY